MHSGLATTYPAEKLITAMSKYIVFLVIVVFVFPV